MSKVCARSHLPGEHNHSSLIQISVLRARKHKRLAHVEAACWGYFCPLRCYFVMWLTFEFPVELRKPCRPPASWASEDKGKAAAFSSLLHREWCTHTTLFLFTTVGFILKVKTLLNKTKHVRCDSMSFNREQQNPQHGGWFDIRKWSV